MLSKEEIEKAKEISSKFMNNEMQRDKLERDNRCGGWKIGDIYKHLELNPAIKTLLQYIDQLEQENNKQSKMIDEMAIMLERLKICYLKKEDGGELLGKYRCYNKDDWKQYFEKKVEGK